MRPRERACFVRCTCALREFERRPLSAVDVVLPLDGKGGSTVRLQFSSCALSDGQYCEWYVDVNVEERAFYARVLPGNLSHIFIVNHQC